MKSVAKRLKDAIDFIQEWIAYLHEKYANINFDIAFIIDEAKYTIEIESKDNVLGIIDFLCKDYGFFYHGLDEDKYRLEKIKGVRK